MSVKKGSVFRHWYRPTLCAREGRYFFAVLARGRPLIVLPEDYSLDRLSQSMLQAFHFNHEP
jgi:hypothetical protein